jgi:hypothetical protein
MRIKIFSKESLIILIFAFIYIFSVGPDPVLGDSLAFTIVASNGFDLATNATNHFLYINFLALSHKILPFINPHHLFVGISITCSLLTLIFLRRFLALFEIKKVNIDILVLLFGFSFTFWRISIITEVYSFYILFVTLFLYHIFSFIKTRKITYFYYSAILFGTMFLIHIQTILLIPFYLYFLYENFRNERINILKGIFIPAIIFSILLIPVVQDKHSFIAIFTDNAWGNSFFELKFETFIKSLGRNLIFLIYNFSLFLFFIVAGIKKAGYKKYFLIALLPYVVFILKHDVSDSYVFHLVPYLFLLVLIGKGLEKLQLIPKYVLVFSLPLIYFMTYKMVKYTGFSHDITTKTGFKGGVRYFFFPPLNGNPTIDVFIKSYEENKFKDFPQNEKNNFERQYQYAKDWVMIKNNF